MKTSAGLYVPAGTDRTSAEQRIAEAWAAAPAGAGLTGWAGLRMNGGAFFDGATGSRNPQSVQVRVGSDLHPRRQPGIRFLRSDVGPIIEIRGLGCVDPLMAVFDAGRLAVDVREAVVVIDMALAARLCTLEELRTLVESRSWRGVPGVPQLRRAVGLASDRSASPPETRLRLVWELDAGLPPPLVNVWVYDRRGTLLGIPDLLDPVAGLVIEYDGDDHRDPARHSDDVDREARFRGVGLEVTRVTGRDLRRTPELVHRLHTARQRARFEPEGARAWVIGR